MEKTNSDYHQPVLMDEVMNAILIKNPGSYADCTTGGGGHSLVLASRLLAGSQLDCFDRDPDAIKAAGLRLASFDFINIHHRPFSEIRSVLNANSKDGILFDLGVSSHQLDDASRGFSFRDEQEVDMRMNPEDPLDALEFLQNTDAEELAAILRDNSDFEKAYKTATLILEGINKLEGPLYPEFFRTILKQVFPGKPHKMNSLLARLFQAIRMEVNSEKSELKQSLVDAVHILQSGGRLCVISYHSVEDRIVKTTLATFEKECICPPEVPVCNCGRSFKLLKKVNNKPLIPTASEVNANPRARSAKLRIYQKV
jgi:16S rRNA (cytosine1402-N4)-methyltransferase